MWFPNRMETAPKWRLKCASTSTASSACPAPPWSRSRKEKQRTCRLIRSPWCRMRDGPRTRWDDASVRPIYHWKTCILVISFLANSLLPTFWNKVCQKFRAAVRNTLLFHWFYGLTELLSVNTFTIFIFCGKLLFFYYILVFCFFFTMKQFWNILLFVCNHSRVICLNICSQTKMQVDQEGQTQGDQLNDDNTSSNKVCWSLIV